MADITVTAAKVALIRPLESDVVNVKLAGETVPSLVSELLRAMVTLAVG